MSDLQAALGLYQMQRLEEFVSKRGAIAENYDSAFDSLPLVTHWQHPDGKSSWHLYIVCLKLDQTSKTHREVFEGLRDAGIGVNLHYISLYRQPFHKLAEGFRSNWPASERCYDEAVAIPLYPRLNGRQKQYVIDMLHKEVGV